jgi:hypothetical protein
MESVMHEIIIDEEFERILPKLEKQSSAQLEEGILQFGCLMPLVLWNGILIDGHNRYEILQRHGLPFNTISMEFNSRDEVIAWIIETQIQRRNLNQLQLSYYRGMSYELEKKVVGNMSKRNQQKVECAQNGHIPENEFIQGSTAKRLAEHYNVSRNTIRRDAQVARAINIIGEKNPEIKIDILSGEIRISRKQLQEMASGTPEQVDTVITQIIDGTHEHRRSNQSEHDLADMQPWEKSFSKMTTEFRQTMRGFAKSDDKSSAKTALRQYIVMLEDLYESF